MRIADKMQFDQVRNNVGKNRSELTNLQNQAATQKRVVKPSDDPTAASRVLFNKTELQGSEQFIKNINYAKSYLDFTDQSLGELSEALVRAKELALAQSNDASANEGTRRIAATEINQMYEQAVQIGNRKLGDRFLFGGYKTTTPPFDFSGQFKGDNGEIMIQINKDAYISTNIPGSRVFMGEGIAKGSVTKTTEQVPLTIDELDKGRQGELRKPEAQPLDEPVNAKEGLNIFNVIKDLEIALKTDHKPSIQIALDQLDDALAQVVLTRSQVGSRIMALDNNLGTLQKETVDSKTSISQLEDVDTVALVSDITKNQSTLQATLATSGKLIQPSLLDFIK